MNETQEEGRARCPEHPVNWTDDCGACWLSTPRPLVEWEQMLAPYGGLAGVLPPPHDGQPS